MSRSITVPDDLYDKTARLAAKDQLSIEEFVSALLAHRIAIREFVESRAGLFNPEEFEQALNQIRDAEPEDRDC